MSNEVFELFEETKGQVIVKVNAKDALTVARHPYANSKMAYITVTRGDDNIFTIVNDDGSTWSWHSGTRGHTLVSASVTELELALKSFLAGKRVFLDVRSELNPYAAEFYSVEKHPIFSPNTWIVDFKFADTSGKGRAYFDKRQYHTPSALVADGLSKYNKLFEKHGAIEETPNVNVGIVYRVEIR